MSRDYTLERYRNFGIMAHNDAGSERLRPRACSTWEGSPLLQAEPLLQARWGRRARCSRAPLTPGMVTLRLWLSLGCSAPLR